MNSLVGVVTEIQVGIEDTKVIIELICANAYAAEVLCDDVVSKLSSEGGLRLNVKATPKVQNGAGR